MKERGGTKADLSPEAVEARFQAAAELYRLARELANAPRLGRERNDASDDQVSEEEQSRSRDLPKR